MFAVGSSRSPETVGQVACPRKTGLSRRADRWGRQSRVERRRSTVLRGEGRGGHRAAFSLLELLIVVLIIGILSSLLLVGVRAVRQGALKRGSQVRGQALLNAMASYRHEYDEWPGQAGSASDRVLASNELATVMDLMINNPRGISYVELGPAALTNGVPLDTWGRAYVVGLDEDEDGRIAIATSLGGAPMSTNVRGRAVAASWGSDPSDTSGHLFMVLP